MADLGITTINLDMNYANPYERIKNTYFDTEYFDQNMWNEAMRKGGQTLGQYANILKQQDKLPSLDIVNRVSGFRNGDIDDKLYYLDLQLNKTQLSDETTKKQRFEPIYDEQTGKTTGEKKDLGEMTDYDYYMYNFNQYGDALEQQEYYKTVEQWKEDRGVLTNTVTGLGGILGDFVIGIPGAIFGLVDLVSNIWAAMWDLGRAAVGDLDIREVDDRMLERFNDDVALNTGLLQLISDKTGGWIENNPVTRDWAKKWQEDLDYWEMNETGLIRADGTVEDWAVLFKGVANMAGGLLTFGAIGKGAQLIGAAGKAGSGVSTASKIASNVGKVISSTGFYANMFQQNMSESVARDPNGEHNLFELLAVNGALTAVDWAVGKGFSALGKGMSKAAALRLGVQRAGSMAKNPLLSSLLTFVKEGAEEVTQDFSVWLLGTAVDKAFGYDNFYSQEFNATDYVYSFLGGALLSVVIGGIDGAIKQARLDTEFQNYFLSEKADVYSDIGYARLVNDYDTYVKNKNELVLRRDSGNQLVFDENTQQYHGKDTPEYEQYYNEQIETADKNITAVQNQIATYIAEFESRTTERLERRKLTYEELDTKQRKEFKRGLLGLLNTMDDAANLAWYAKNGKNSPKVAKYFAGLVRTGYQTISTLYGAMGKTQFANMTKLLSQLETSASKSRNDAELKSRIESITQFGLSQTIDLISTFNVDKTIVNNVSNCLEKTKEKIRKIKKSKPDKTKDFDDKFEVKAVFDGKNFKDDTGKPFPIKASDEPNAEGLDENIVNTANKLKKEGIDLAMVSPTNEVHSNENTILLPENRALDHPEAIKTSAAVTRAITGISANLPLNIKQEISNLYSEYSNGKFDGKITFEEILRLMVLDSNATLFNFMIKRSSKFTVRMFVNLKAWIETSLKAELKGPLDANLQGTLNTMSKNMTPAIITYCKNMKDTDDAILQSIYKVLNENQIHDIKKHRYNYLLRDKIVNSPNDLSDVDKKIIDARIKNMVMLTRTEKDEIRNKIYSAKRNERIDGTNIMDNYYDGIFNGPYNNETYLKDNGTTGVQVFNWWLEQNNLTVKYLKSHPTEATRKFNEFSLATSQRYQAKFDSNVESGINILDTNYEFNEYQSFTRTKRFTSRRYHELAAENNLLVSDVFNSLLSDTVDVFQKDMLTVQDLMTKPDYYFNEVTKKEIGVLHRDKIYKYLNDKLHQKYGLKYAIRQDRSGTYRLFTYVKGETILKSDLKFTPSKLKINQEHSYTADEFISKKYLNGPLKDLKVILRGAGNTEFDAANNEIHINVNLYGQTENDFKTTLLHEFTHALDYYNGFNMGMTAIKTIPQDVLNDFNKHTGLKLTGEQLQSILYTYTGELGAEGDEFTFINLPLIVNTLSNGLTEITTPWNSKITLAGDTIVKFNNITYQIDTRQLTQKRHIVDELGNEFDSNVTDEYLNLSNKVKQMSGVTVLDYHNFNIKDVFTAFILPDGTLISVNDIYHDVFVKRVSDKVGNNFADSMIHIRNNAKLIYDNNGDILQEAFATNNRNINKFLSIEIGNVLNQFSEIKITIQALNTLEVCLDKVYLENGLAEVGYYYNAGENNIWFEGKDYIYKTAAQYRDDIEKAIYKTMLKQQKRGDLYTKAEGSSNIQKIRDARHFVSEVDRAWGKRGNKSFGVTDTDYDLPIEILQNMKIGKYQYRKDIPNYAASAKLLRQVERAKKGEFVKQEKRETGLTYSHRPLSKTKAKGTLAEFYINNDKYSDYRGTFSQGMSRFLYQPKATVNKLDEKLVRLIREERITDQGIWNYIRDNWNEMNDYTFEIIQKSFFPNSVIKNKDELSAFIVAARDLYAIDGAFKHNDLFEYTGQDLPEYLIREGKYLDWIINVIKTNPILDKRYKHLGKKYDENYNDIDAGQLALSTLRYFNGTLDSASYVINIALSQARGHYKSRTDTEKPRSIDETIKAYKGDDKDRTVADFIADNSGEDETVQDYAKRIYILKLNQTYNNMINKENEQLELGNKLLAKENAKLAEVNRLLNRVKIAYNKAKLANNLDAMRKQKINAKKLKEDIATFENNIEKLNKDIDIVKNRIEKIVDDMANHETGKYSNKVRAFEEEISEWSNDELEVWAENTRRTLDVEIDTIDDFDEYEKLLKSYMPRKGKSPREASNAFRLYVNRNLKYITDKHKALIPENLKPFITFNKYGQASFDFSKATTRLVDKPRMHGGGTYQKTRMIAADDIVKLHDDFKLLVKNIKADNKINEGIKKQNKEYETKIKKLSKKVETKERALTKLEKSITKSENKNVKIKIDKNNHVQYEYKINNLKTPVTSNKPMPDILRKLYDTEFTKIKTSKMKVLTDKDNQYVAASLTEYIQQHADDLRNLTDEDINNIIEFYQSSWLPPFEEMSPDELRLYFGMKQFMLNYIQKLNEEGALSLTDSASNAIRELIASDAKLGYGITSTYTSAMRTLKPWQIMTKQLRKMYNVDFEEDELKALHEYIETGDTQQLAKSLRVMYSKLGEQYTAEKNQKKFEHFVTNMINYMRASMLTAPSTIIRSKVSNITITETNKITKSVGSFAVGLTRKFVNIMKKLEPASSIKELDTSYKEGQVNLSQKLNIKADPDKKGYFIGADKNKEGYDTDPFIANFVNDFADKSGVMDLIGDNISRYDTAIKNSQDKSDIEFVLASKVMEQVRNDLSYDDKAMAGLKKLAKRFGLKEADEKIPDKFVQFVFNLHSDSRWINKVFKKYFSVLIKNDNLEPEIRKIFATIDERNNVLAMSRAMVKLAAEDSRLRPIVAIYENTKIEPNEEIRLSNTINALMEASKKRNLTAALDKVLKVAEEYGYDKKLTFAQILQMSKRNILNPYLAVLSNTKIVDAISQAYGYAAYEYIHRGNWISDMLNNLRKTRPNLALGLQLFMPFLSGGWNWFYESLKYNPVAGAIAIGRFIKLDAEVAKAQKAYDEYKLTGKGKRPAYNPRFIEYSIRNDIGKGVWGTALMLVAMALTKLGFIVKDEDDETYKLNFGGFYLDISSLFGSEPVLTGAALMDEATSKDVDILKVLDAAITTSTENFFMTDLMNMTAYNKTRIEVISDMLINTIGAFVPNIWKSLVRTTKDAKMKYSSGVLGDLEYLAYSIVPFLNWNKRIDPFTGELEVQYSDSFIINLLNEAGVFGGMKVKTNVLSDIELIVRDLGLDIGELKGEYDDVGKLPYGTLNAIYGKLNKKDLADFINNKVAYEVDDAKDKNKKVTLKYSKMTNEQKKQAIERIKRNNSNYAKIYTWTSLGHKYYTNSSEYAKLRKLGITDKVYLKKNKLEGFVK